MSRFDSPAPQAPAAPAAPLWARMVSGGLIGLAAGLLLAAIVAAAALAASLWLGPAVWPPAARLMAGACVLAVILCVWRNARKR